uniref:Uncharacterized protein n=1 Tax=Avena sativa TaxID=4498 RepID=A0ACD5WRF4_AVESA
MDVVGAAAGDDHIAPPEEYEDIVSTLPTAMTFQAKLLYQYQGGWVIYHRIRGLLSFQQRFTPRSGDVLLASPPKCGTTWLKALSFATMARAAYPPNAAEHPLLRLNPHDCVPFVDDLFSAGHHDQLEALPSPRLMNTHMQHAQLPPSVADNPDCKIVYVCREPKDMLVSMWHFVQNVRPVTFSDLFEVACEGKTPDGPFWDHILGYWSASRSSPERVMFLQYEEMMRDPVGVVRELARFLGLPFSAAEEAAGLPASIAKLCSMEVLKGLDANKIGTSGVLAKYPHKSYFRKGVVGDWINHMTPETAVRFDAIVHDKIRGSGLSFRSPLV